MKKTAIKKLQLRKDVVASLGKNQMDSVVGASGKCTGIGPVCLPYVVLTNNCTFAVADPTLADLLSRRINTCANHCD